MQTATPILVQNYPEMKKLSDAIPLTVMEEYLEELHLREAATVSDSDYE